LDSGLRVVDTGLSGANARLSDAEELAYMVPPVVPGAVEAQAGMYATQEGLSAAQMALPEPELQPEPELPMVEQPELPEEVAPTIEPDLPQPELTEEVAPTIEPELPAPDLPQPELTEEVAPTIEPELPGEVAPTIEPELPAVEQLTPTIEPELPQEVTPSEEQKNKLTDAIKTIVDEIAKQVESNLTDGSPQENSFDALAGAVGKMGGKRRNTRRFKLVKNKTKRAIKQMANTL
jgi:hypothetical protein